VTVTAFGFQSFLEEHLNTSGFGIDEVDRGSSNSSLHPWGAQT